MKIIFKEQPNKDSNLVIIDNYKFDVAKRYKEQEAKKLIEGIYKTAKEANCDMCLNNNKCVYCNSYVDDIICNNGHVSEHYC